MSLRLITILFLFNVPIVFSKIPDFMLNDGRSIENKKHICIENCCRSKYNFDNQDILQSTYQKQIYDVLSYNLWLDLSYYLDKADKSVQRPDTLYYQGKQKVTLRIDSAGYNTFYLDATNMIINNVIINSTNANYSVIHKYQKIGKLEFVADSNFEVGDTLELEIDYEVRRNRQFGIYYNGRIIGDNSEGSEPLIYTQSETSLARYWMPCNDRPYDKSITSISLTVPTGFIGLSNGNLDSVRSGLNGEIKTETYYYSHSSPISTYLTNVVASKFSYFKQYYPRYTNNLDTVPITNYMWEIDLNPPEGHLFDGKKALHNQPEMLKFYSSKFGEYSFNSYGTVAVTPYMYGGMEHQTLTTIHRNWLRINSDVGLAHEIAHHWIGNLLTCASWNDIWINEGGATWCEALWIEEIMKNDKYYYNHLLAKSNYYFSKENTYNQKIYGVSENEVFEYPQITYDKASWVYHMLSEIVGRNKFFEIMEGIFENNKFVSVSTSEFIELLKSNIDEPKMELDLFFEQWIYDSGHPIYDISSEVTELSDSKFAYDVFVSQIQEGEGFRDIYEMPVDIIFYDENDSIVKSESVYNNSRNQKFSFELDFNASKVLIDYRKVLCQIKQIILSTKDKNNNDIEIITAPNPVESGSQISIFYADNIQISEVKIFDLYGKIIYEKIGNFTINNIKAPLTAGIYIIEMSTNQGIQRRKIIVN